MSYFHIVNNVFWNKKYQANGVPIPFAYLVPGADMFMLPRDLQHDEEEDDHGLLIRMLPPISSMVGAPPRADPLDPLANLMICLHQGAARSILYVRPSYFCPDFCPNIKYRDILYNTDVRYLFSYNNISYKILLKKRRWNKRYYRPDIVYAILLHLYLAVARLNNDHIVMPWPHAWRLLGLLPILWYMISSS